MKLGVFIVLFGDKTLEEASKHLYRVEEIIFQTKRAMIYPAFVIFSISSLSNRLNV